MRLIHEDIKGFRFLPLCMKRKREGGLMEVDMVILFKAELKNLRLLESLLDLKRLELSKVLYQMQGIKGIDPSKEYLGVNTEFDRILDLMPKKDELMNDITVLTIRIRNVYKVLDQMNDEERRLITEIYIEGVTFEEMSERSGYSVSGLKKKTHKILKKVLGHPLEPDNIVM